MPRRLRVAFVNGGILGLTTYASWLREAIAPGELDATHIVLTEHLTMAERVRRRILCQRFWPDPPGLRNLDLARYRQEWHAGLLARKRLAALGADRFDVLHFHGQATAYASLDLMRRIPSIVSIDCTQTCALQAATSAVERTTIGANVRRDGRVFGRAAAIVSTSAWALQDLRRMYPACTAPLHVNRWPVSPAAFDATWIDERAARAAAQQPVRLLFVGGDFPRKGGYDLLAAWQAGGFAGRATLTLVTDWPVGRLPAGVTLVSGVASYTPAWREMWRDADVFVMVTRNEAFGLVYQEAGAAGLPVIGSALNAVPEIVGHEESGLLVTPRDRPALVAAMERLIASAETRERMGRAGRTRTLRAADPDHHKTRLLEIIHQVSRPQVQTL